MNATAFPAPDLNAFLADWRHLVATVVRSMGVPAGVPADEAEADGLLGLWQAAGSYRPGRGATWPTWAARRIRGAVLDGLRERTCARRAGYTPPASLDALRADLSLDPEGRASDPPREAADAEFAARLRALAGPDADFVPCLLGERLQADLARERGVCPTAVTQRVKALRERLRGRLAVLHLEETR